MNVKKSLGMFMLAGLLLSSNVFASAPFVSDSRIRTMVYSENEVFKLVTEFGYQSNIEFGKGEDILTLSIGDPISFKVTPTGNRLFVKALRNNSHTNMTLITTKRTYQFELSSVVENDRDIMYVMRFYYPAKTIDEAKVVSKVKKGRKPSSFSGADLTRSSGKKLAIQQVSADSLISGSRIKNRRKKKSNTQYSVSGERSLSPLMVFDDGRSTFFKFPPSPGLPTFYVVHPDGTESSIPARKEGEYVAINGVHARLALRVGPSVICVFNDNAVPLTLTAR